MKDFELFDVVIYTVALIVVGAFIYGISMYKLDKNTSITGNVTCEHEYVISSKYDWWFEQYRTISKCTKCGKEI